MLPVKRLIFIILTIPVASLLCAILNLVTDPFGAFGDHFYNMHNYNMSINARIEKITYLDNNYKKFDSYIVGGSKAGALIPKSVEKYMLSTRFYNLCVTGGRLYDYEYTTYYLVNKYKAKNIVLHLSQLEINKPGTSTGVTGRLHGKLFSDFPFAFYLNLMFQDPVYAINKIEKHKIWTKEYSSSFFYQIDTGCYNRTQNEKDIKVNPDTYFKDKNKFQETRKKITNPAFDYNLQSIKRIVNFCKQKKVNLILIASPTYLPELETYPLEGLSRFMKDMANVCDYWNFSGYNSINKEITNFYDGEHYRIKIGDLMLARIFSDKSVKVPEDFGMLINRKNAEAEITKAFKPAK